MPSMASINNNFMNIVNEIIKKSSLDTFNETNDRSTALRDVIIFLKITTLDDLDKWFDNIIVIMNKIGFHLKPFPIERLKKQIKQIKQYKMKEINNKFYKSVVEVMEIIQPNAITITPNAITTTPNAITTTPPKTRTSIITNHKIVRLFSKSSELNASLKYIFNSFEIKYNEWKKYHTNHSHLSNYQVLQEINCLHNLNKIIIKMNKFISLDEIQIDGNGIIIITNYCTYEMIEEWIKRAHLFADLYLIMIRGQISRYEDESIYFDIIFYWVSVNKITSIKTIIYRYNELVNSKLFNDNPLKFLTRIRLFKELLYYQYREMEKLITRVCYC